MIMTWRKAARSTSARLTAAGLVFVIAPMWVTPAMAESRDGKPETSGTGPVGDVISDFALPEVGLADPGPDLMPDSLTQARLQYPDATCSYVGRNDRSTSGPPPNATEQQIIYFRPTDAPNTRYDQATVCNDGVSIESNIGYSNHNTRKWMGSQTTAQGARLSGKAYKFNVRSYTAYSRSFKFVNVMYLIGNSNTAYYQTDTYNRLALELRSRGWDHLNVKYIVHADVRAAVDPTTGSSPAGQAAYNSNKGFVYRRGTVKKSDGSTSAVQYRWGCFDEGDTPAIHEANHAMGTVAPGSADYYSAGSGTTAKHVSQRTDLMSWSPQSTLSGKSSGGGVFPVGPLEWDQGAESYTNRVLGFPSYLVGSPTQPFHTCP